MPKKKDRPVKNTTEVFKRLKITKDPLSEGQKNFLETKGYLIIKPTSFYKINMD